MFHIFLDGCSAPIYIVYICLKELQTILDKLLGKKIIPYPI